LIQKVWRGYRVRKRDELRERWEEVCRICIETPAGDSYYSLGIGRINYWCLLLVGSYHGSEECEGVFWEEDQRSKDLGEENGHKDSGFWFYSFCS